ncbi:MAG: class I SAM-dependent methyltransferase [Tepidisphaeraceae bacterium]
MASVLQRIKTRFYYWRFDLRCIALDQILPHQTDLILNLRNWSKDLRAGSILDSIVLASVARCFQPTVCVEIGTGDGRSATIVAANTPPNAMIYTLDSEFPNDPVKGSVFRGLPEAAKIQQFGGYSTSFDFSRWYGITDFVFVDGSHEFDAVLSDSEIAFKLLKPGGIILWHDLNPRCPGVLKALQKCSRSKDVLAINQTDSAYYRAPA